MPREIKIIEMIKEEYMEKFGAEYSEGNLFDYPLEELSYIMKETDIETLALIEDRLFEIPR